MSDLSPENELLMMVIRRAQPAADIAPERKDPSASMVDTLQAQAAEEFADEVTAEARLAAPVTCAPDPAAEPSHHRSSHLSAHLDQRGS